MPKGDAQGPDHRRARLDCLAGVNRLHHADVAHGEGGLAVGQVVIPFADETRVEIQRADGGFVLIEGDAPAFQVSA
jgi:hypothetical protein